MKTSLNKSIESLMLGLALSTGTGHRWVGEEGGMGVGGGEEGGLAGRRSDCRCQISEKAL
jgi:hypothetical protein